MAEPRDNAHREVQRLIRTRDWPAALIAIDRAVSSDPHNPAYHLHRAHCLLALGRRTEALAAADEAVRQGGADPAIWDAVGTLRTHAREPRSAIDAYERAIALAPGDYRFWYNRAAVRRFLGDLDGAEADYDQAIALNPSDITAYLNRSQLRTQSTERNHVAELESMARKSPADWRAEVHLAYALAKEYEDLGDYATSFQHLRRGATRHREHIDYDVSVDVATACWISEAYPKGPAEPAPDASDASPIFIVGLPRSGSTLVERILGSHSMVSSAGELDCFALALVDAVRRSTNRAQIPRRELVARSAALDFPALGRDYLQRVNAVHEAAGRPIDKMPLNYLYCGLIHRALPKARIIHVTRHPMAAGYAMYKTLFDRGYPFSYDLGEIAQYLIAYRRLMEHWRSTIPAAIHEVRYERLVADPERQTRELLAFCGLEWQDACRAFHENPDPSMTASALQVRRPLYDSSVAQWRHYEAQLAPLEEALRGAGVDTGAT